jgi:hypothetical protein
MLIDSRWMTILETRENKQSWIRSFKVKRIIRGLDPLAERALPKCVYFYLSNSHLIILLLAIEKDAQKK